MLRAKQLDHNLAGIVQIKSLSVTGANATVTSAITNALATAGRGGASVPVQVSNGLTLGLLVSPGANDVQIWDSATQRKIGTADEVYARLTFSSPNYLITFYQLINGLETPYNFSTATNIDIEFLYVFDFHRLPVGFAVSRRIYNDPTGETGSQEKRISENLTPTGLNTLPPMSKTPTAASSVILHVNEASYGAPPGHITLSGKQLTWVRAVTGFDLATDDSVWVAYSTLE